MLAALFKVWQFVRSAAVRICAYTIQRLQSEETRPASPCAPDDARVALHMLRCGRQVSEKNPPLAPRQRRLQAPSPRCSRYTARISGFLSAKRTPRFRQGYGDPDRSQCRHVQLSWGTPMPKLINCECGEVCRARATKSY